jgi:muconate cycloisomerase
VAHSLASHRATANLAIKLWDARGRAGWGEGVPREFVTGERLEHSLDFLRQQALPRILSADLDALPPLTALATLLTPDEMDRFPAAACALETAWLDLLGQRQGQPLSWFLGGQARDRMIYSGVVPLAPLEQLPALLHMARELQFREVKLKLAGGDDLERVGMAQEILGHQTSLRVDVNGAWSRDQARQMIPALAALGVAEVEQPLEAGDREGLVQLGRESASLILADESVCTPSQARDLASLGVRLGLNLRLSKCGGLSRTLAMLQIARQRGLPCQLGCQVGELGILTAAGRHLAAVAPDLIHLEGSLTPFFLDRDLTSQDLGLGRGGQAPALGGPGLGIQVQESSLASSLVFSSAPLPRPASAF